MESRPAWRTERPGSSILTCLVARTSRLDSTPQQSKEWRADGNNHLFCLTQPKCHSWNDKGRHFSRAHRPRRDDIARCRGSCCNRNALLQVVEHHRRRSCQRVNPVFNEAINKNCAAQNVYKGTEGFGEKRPKKTSTYSIKPGQQDPMPTGCANIARGLTHIRIVR